MTRVISRAAVAVGVARFVYVLKGNDVLPDGGCGVVFAEASAEGGGVVSWVRGSVGAGFDPIPGGPGFESR